MLDQHSVAAPRGRAARLVERLTHAPYLLLPLPPLFWSANFVVGRAVAGALPPVGLAFWRWCLAAALLWSVAWPLVRRDWPVITRQLPILLLLSLLGIAAFNTLVYIGLGSTTAVNGVLMQSVMPVGIVALSWLLFRERTTRRQLSGILLSLLGVVVIVARGELATILALRLNRGDLLILLAVVSYAAYSALLRRRPAIHPFSFLTISFTAGAAMLLPLYLWEHLAVQPMPLSSTTLFAVGYVAIFPSILAYLCFNRGVELVGANRAGLFIHLMPVFGSLLAMFFLDERLQLFHALGATLILAGIALATRRSRA